MTQCKHNLGENHLSKSVNCDYQDRGWISLGNCGSCTHRNEETPEKTVKANLEENKAVILQDFACPNTIQTEFMLWGRLCTFDKCSCFNWNKPELVKICPTIQAGKKREILSERIETDFYATLPGGSAVQ